MPLIVEDGTMPDGANSYVSLADADAYLVQRGLWETTPTDGGEATTSKKETAIIRAFDVLNTLKWKGNVADWQRTIAWPRENVPMPGPKKKGSEEPEFLPSDIVPGAVVQAQMELAALVYGGLNPLAPVERGGKVISMSESTKEGDLDVIGGDSKSYSVTYSDSAPVETYLPAVYGILTPFLAEIPGKTMGLVWGEVLRG